MEHNDIKGPDTPRPPHWMGDEPMQTVGDPMPKQEIAPHSSIGGRIEFWEAGRPIHPDIFPIIGADPGRETVPNNIPSPERQNQ